MLCAQKQNSDEGDLEKCFLYYAATLSIILVTFLPSSSARVANPAAILREYISIALNDFQIQDTKESHSISTRTFENPTKVEMHLKQTNIKFISC